jgi:hypothetical protein
VEYTYVVRGRNWLVGAERRYPGDLIPEAATFPNLRVYVDNKWIEKIPVDDPEVVAIMEKATAPAPKPAAPEVTRVELPRRLVPARPAVEEPAKSKEPAKPTEE